MTLLMHAIERDRRKRPIGGGMGHGQSLDHCTVRGCFFDEVFFCLLYAKTDRRSGHSFFLLRKTGVTWNLCCLENKQNQKLSTTKDLDMVKNFFWWLTVVPRKFKNRAGITLFVCRNRYNFYDSVGFVPGGSIFGTLCTTQDETMSIPIWQAILLFAKTSGAGTSTRSNLNPFCRLTSISSPILGSG